jgi:hypothetical protein
MTNWLNQGGGDTALTCEKGTEQKILVGKPEKEK